MCRYSITNVETAMKGLFKQSQSFMPYRPYASCDDYKILKHAQVDSYYKNITNYEKFQIEDTINQRALFALNNVKFVSLAVDPSFQQEKMHILFIGSNDGRLFKIITQPHILENHVQPIIVSEYQLFENKIPINNLLISIAKNNPNKIIAITSESIKSISVDVSCSKFLSCEKCTNSQDPYCSWSFLVSKCVYTLVRFDSSLSIKMSKCYEESTPVNGHTQITGASEIDFLNDTKTVSPNYFAYQSNRQPWIGFSLGAVILIIVAAVLVSCIFSIILTLFYVKNNFLIGQTTRNSSDAQQNEKTSNFVYYETLRNYMHHYLSNVNTEFSVKNDREQQTRRKVSNCYESKPVTVLCIEPGSSNLPFALENTSCSLASNSNSPNNNFESENILTSTSKCSTINDTLSTTDDCFELQPFVETDNSKRKFSSSGVHRKNSNKNLLIDRKNLH